MKHPLIALADIPDQGTKVVEFFGREVHVYKADGACKAALSICSHFGGPLACKDGKLVCQWHNAEFALKDGAALCGPAPKGSSLMFLSTKAEDGVLYYVWGE